jgi:hypothetical protein
MRRQLLLAVAMAPLLIPGVAGAAEGGAARQLPRPKVESLPASRTRITFPAAGKQGYTVTWTGDRLVVRHGQGGRIADLPRMPHNVLAMTSEATVTELRLAPGARVQTHPNGARLIVELQDPPADVRMGSMLSSVLASPVPVPEPEELPSALIAEQTSQVAVPQPTETVWAVGTPNPAAPGGPLAPTLPVAADVPVSAVQVREPANPAAPAGPTAIEAAAGPSVLLPSPADTGAAALWSGPDLLIILDWPIDFTVPATGLDRQFQQIGGRRTQDATIVRISNAPASMHLVREPRGWLVATGPGKEPLVGIMPQIVKNGPDQNSMRLPAAAVSRVVVMNDPQTGAHLLVGTQGVAGQGVTTQRTLSQFSLLPTVQGVAVATNSDDVRLLRKTDGFELSGGPHAGNTIFVSDEPRGAGARLIEPTSRLFSLVSDSVPSLLHLLNEQTRNAALAPALARSEPRTGLAETLVSLGMGVEAQAVLDVMMADDPALRDKPLVMGLRAVASLLAHRYDKAAALTDPRLNGTMEIDLWRALLGAALGRATPQDAHRIAAGLPILLSYAQPLRDRLLPRALETMALNGQAAAAEAALQGLPDEPAIDLTRGMVQEAGGHADVALATYDRLAGQDDRLSRYRAIVRATELRLKTGQLSVAQATEALDRALFSWRGAQQELELRTRIAQLRCQAGQWREALAVLRDGRTAFPDDHDAIDRAMGATFDAMLTGGAAKDMPAAEFVPLFDQNADIVKAMTWTERNGMPLVDRLMSLSLPGRAEPVLSQIIVQTADPVRKAVLGARLASLRMDNGNAAGTIQALAETAPPAGVDIDPVFQSARQMLYARAELARGHRDVALRMLDAIGTAESDALRADTFGARGEWPSALGAITALEGRLIGPAGAPAQLSAKQQAVVLRLAVAATLAGDTATLQRVTTAYGPAMEKSESSSRFRLMTSAPVRGTADLPRAFEEIKLVQQMEGQVGSEVRR